LDAGIRVVPPALWRAGVASTQGPAADPDHLFGLGGTALLSADMLVLWNRVVANGQGPNCQSPEVTVVFDLPDGWRPPFECASKLLEIMLAVHARRLAEARAA
jgi:hypothetical protein